MLEPIQKLLVNLVKLFTTPLLFIGDTNISLSKLFQLGIYSIVVLLLGRAFKNLLKRVLLLKLGIDEPNREGISTIFSYALSALAIIVILQTQGVNISSLAVLAGGLGVGIGLGFQNITKNFISGLNVLIERPIKIGDFIEFENNLGFVEEIGLRSTRIRTLRNSHIIIPNGMLIEGKIHNLSYNNTQGLIEVDIFVCDDSDAVLVTEAVLMSAYMEPAVLQEPPPKVLFQLCPCPTNGIVINSININFFISQTYKIYLENLKMYLIFSIIESKFLSIRWSLILPFL